MYDYNFINEVIPKVVSTSRQKKLVILNDLTEFWCIKNVLAKTSYKTAKFDFLMKFSVFLLEICVPLNMLKTSKKSKNLWLKNDFYLTLKCKEYINVK